MEIPDPTFETGDVHLWRARLDVSSDRVYSLYALLSADERAAAERYRFPIHRQRFIIARGTLRSLLGAYCNCDPKALHFEREAKGKPFLPCKPVRFNLSHASDLALYAIAKEREVGVDLEAIRPVRAERLAQRFFKPGEYEAIARAERDCRLELFFQYWTCKEACLKGTGEGLSGLSALEIDLDCEPIACRWHGRSRCITSGELTSTIADTQGKCCCDWTIYLPATEPGYAAALAVEGNGATVCEFGYAFNWKYR